MVSTVRILAWELVCSRVLSLAHCSSVWCWKRRRVLITDTQEECISKLKSWKTGMETKGLHVDMKKTKFLLSDDDQDFLQKSGKYPCALCYSWVSKSCILCSKCMRWVHKTCSVLTKRLVEDPNYICPRCKGVSQPIDGWTVIEVDVDGTRLDAKATFCYLGDILCSGRGCDSAIAARWCVTLRKFGKLLPVLISPFHLFTQDTWQGVCGLRLLGFAPW